MPKKDEQNIFGLFDLFSESDKPKKKTRKTAKEENPFAEAFGSLGDFFPGPESQTPKRKRRTTKSPSKESLRVKGNVDKTIQPHSQAIEPVQPRHASQGAIPSTESTNTSASESDSEFRDVLQQIKQWIPLKRYTNEEGYHPDLHNFLRDKCGHVTHLEEGTERADIVVDNRFPIELKKNPTQGEYDRMLGQLLRNECAYGYAIGVVCDVRRQEAFQDFLATVDRTKGDKKIEILMK